MYILPKKKKKEETEAYFVASKYYIRLPRNQFCGFPPSSKIISVLNKDWQGCYNDKC